MKVRNLKEASAVIEASACLINAKSAIRNYSGEQAFGRLWEAVGYLENGGWIPSKKVTRLLEEILALLCEDARKELARRGFDISE